MPAVEVGEDGDIVGTVGGPLGCPWFWGVTLDVPQHTEEALEQGKGQCEYSSTTGDLQRERPPYVASSP